MEYKGVLISAGHSDADPGAVSNGKSEASLTLRIRDKVVEALRGPGFGIPGEKVISDGEKERNQSLPFAIGLAKKVAGPKVEFHFNSGPPNAKGIEALSTPENKPLALALAQAVSQVTGSPLRGDHGWKDQSKAGPHSRLGFCVHGGVILELAFITNKKELETYLSKEDEVAEAVASVVELYARRKGV